MPSRDGRSSRWDQHRQERRLTLVRAARAAVHELGPAASMDEIAAHAGTSKSVFYRYFGDRAGLRLAVAQRVTAHMERRLLEAAETADDGPATLHRMVEVYLSVAATSPHVYAFAVSAPQSAADQGADESGPVLASFFERVYALLEIGMARHLDVRGTPVPLDSPVHLWPRAAVGLVRAAAETWLQTPETERPDAAVLAESITGWLLRGVLGTSPAVHAPAQDASPRTHGPRAPAAAAPSPSDPLHTRAPEGADR